MKGFGLVKEDKILIVEPICVSHEHVGFNKAFISIIEENNESIDMVCEKKHFENLFLKKAIYLKGVPLKRKNTNRLIFFLREIFFSFYIFMLSYFKYEKVVFLSCTKTNILVFGFLSLFFRGERVFIVHSLLSTLGSDNKLISLKRVLSLFLKNNKLIVLGESIKKNMSLYFVDMRNVYSVPHFYEMDEEKCNIKHEDREFYFSFLGVVKKAHYNLKEISEKSLILNDDNFRIVGYSNEKLDGIRFFISPMPVPSDKYISLIKNTKFIVSCLDKERYRLCASGTFFDAIKNSVPGVFLRNDFIEFYFQKFGPVGYLCESNEDIVFVLEDILNNGIDEDFYSECILNIDRAKKHFDPRYNVGKLSELGL